jgi:transaldolase
LSEIGLLGDFDAICLTKDQVDRLKWCQIAISTPDDSSPSALRARQAQFPTRFLESEVGFMNVMSAETRSMVAATMFVALGEMKAHMDVLQKIVAKEVTKQFELQTLDLSALYSLPTARRETTQTSASCVAPGDDEVF